LKTLVKDLMMQISFWVMAMAAIVILSGNAAYAEESAPNGRPADGYIFTLNKKSAEILYEMKEQRLKAIEARKADQEEQARKQEKKAKIERLQGKTGRTATSWQVLNR
jgi:hypothetical protein